MKDYQFLQIANADTAVAEYNRSMQMEEGNGLEIDIWHLLIGLRALCKDRDIDFREIVEDALKEPII